MGGLRRLETHFATARAVLWRRPETPRKKGGGHRQQRNPRTGHKPVPVGLEKILLGSHYRAPFFFFFACALSSSGGVRKS